MKKTHRRAAAVPCVLGSLIAMLCVVASAEAQSPRTVRPFAVTFDGSVGEWPTDVVATADEDYLYVRFSTLRGAVSSLQSGNHVTSIWLDVDGDGATGYNRLYPDVVRGLGFELEIQFSPMAMGKDRPDSGTAVYLLASDGEYTRMGHAAIGVAALPTHASDKFEVRIARYGEGLEGLPLDGLRTSGIVRGVFVAMDNSGAFLGWSDPFAVRAPTARQSPPQAPGTVAPKPRGGIRVLSYNVFDTAPTSNPDPFARIIRAVDPDVVLLQEWHDGDAQEIEAWFTQHVPSPKVWFVIRGEGRGVAIASRLPIRPIEPMTIVGQSGNVRSLSAVVRHGTTDVGVTSVHLKCCGSLDTTEDAQRIEEAGLINAVLESAYAARPPAVRLIAGDFNLVGSTKPLEVLAHGLDRDGSSLSAATPLSLGKPAALTWRNPRSSFSPSRLDYVLFSDSSAVVTQAFILDTGLLSDESLRALGLMRDDATASDHLPVVVDVRAR